MWLYDNAGSSKVFFYFQYLYSAFIRDPKRLELIKLHRNMTRLGINSIKIMHQIEEQHCIMFFFTYSVTWHFASGVGALGMPAFFISYTDEPILHLKKINKFVFVAFLMALSIFGSYHRLQCVLYYVHSSDT